MTETDDPMTIAMVALPLLMGKKSKKDKGFEPPPEPQDKKTAAPVGQISEQQKKNRRLQASMLEQGFSKPKLGVPGLFGGGLS